MTNRWRRTALTTAAALPAACSSSREVPRRNPRRTRRPDHRPARRRPRPSEFATRVDLTCRPRSRPVSRSTSSHRHSASTPTRVSRRHGPVPGRRGRDGAQIKAGSTGLATLKHTFTTAGPHTVSVQYLGGGKITGVTETAAASSTQGTITAVEQDVATVVEILPNDTPVETGVPTLKAKCPCSPAGFCDPHNGKVSFYDGDDLLGTATSILTDGTASIKATFLHAGTRTVTARFSATPGSPRPPRRTPRWSAAQGSGHQHHPAGTQQRPGRQPVTLTATVTAQLPADGTVQFLSGSTPLGAPVPVVDGVATAAHIFGKPANTSVTAVFTGTGFVTSTSAPAPLSISAAQPGTPPPRSTAPAAPIPVSR